MNQPLCIAVADDEPDMREYFQKSLTRLGHKVVAVAENGRQLVEQCRTAHPDLIITDLRMPELDGIEAVAAICKDRPVPVILISAHQNDELRGRAEANHVLGYLVKPIKRADLEWAIFLALRRFEQAERLRQETADLKQTREDRTPSGRPRAYEEDKPGQRGGVPSLAEAGERQALPTG